MRTTKEFKIGEYAIGGIIWVDITGQSIKVSARDWSSKEVVDEQCFPLALTRQLTCDLDEYLNELTSHYYAEQVLEWIKSKVELVPLW